MRNSHAGGVTYGAIGARTSNRNHFKPLMNQHANTKDMLLNHLNQRFSIGSFGAA